MLPWKNICEFFNSLSVTKVGGLDPDTFNENIGTSAKTCILKLLQGYSKILRSVERGCARYGDLV